LDLQGQRFVHGGDRSGNNHCPEKMHYIQGADDLLNEMRCMASGARGKCKAAPSRDWYCTLEEGARFKVEVNGGVPVHIDESLDKHNQHFRQVHPALPLVSLVKSPSFITAVVADQGHMHGAHRRRRC
jgi:hypothetical protein